MPPAFDVRAGPSGAPMTTGTLSVVVPCYNHARYLPTALGALAAQSAAPLEVIIVDDASTDDSASVARSFAARHPFMSVVRHGANRGVPETLKTGWERCRGDYVAFCAADDMVRPRLFEKSLSLLARHPRAGLCSTLADLIDEDGRELGPYHTRVISPRPVYLSPAEFVSTYEREGSWLLTYSAVYRRAALAESGAFAMTAELLRNLDAYKIFFAGAKYGACFIPERLVCWRRLEDSWGFRSLDGGLRESLEHLERLERCLRGPRCAGLFPETFFQAFWRRSIDVIIYEHCRRRPESVRELAQLEARLPRPTRLDRAFFAALRRGWGGAGLAKAYITLHKPWAERGRLLARKLAGLGGGA
ncbi:MAG: glycosyltransferase family A protein [Elusimicrobia bacterium]|nr:glycosyltransferase family A protein [Elusimicrobiota bacterium]